MDDTEKIDTRVDRKDVLRATDVGPVRRAAGPDRRGVLGGVLSVAIGLPIVSAGCVEVTSDQELIEEYSQPEAVEDVVAENDDLFGTLDEIGFFDGTIGSGLIVNPVTIDGENQPELRLYVGTDYGVLSLVVSPEGAPFGPHAHVVTNEAMIEAAPFEWPAEKVTEFPDAGYLFRVEPDGWAEPGFREAEMLDDIKTPDEICFEKLRNPIENGCRGPAASDECAYRNCCGMIIRHDPGECPDSGDDDGLFSVCEDDEEECDGFTCWEKDDGTCECGTVKWFNC